MPVSPPKDNPPWLFGLVSIPWGISTSGVTSLLVPYILRKHGVSVDRIAEVVAVGSMPLMCSFFAAPIVDLGLPRKIWVVLAACISGFLAWAGIVMSSGPLPALTAILFTATVAQTLINSANGGLLAAVNPAVRGRAAGFYTAGNLGAGALGGGGLIWLADHVSLFELALLTALFIIGPALAAFWIQELPHPTQPIRSQFRALFDDFKDVLSSRRTWLGLVFLLSPVGIGAVSNLVSSIGPDYHASGNQIAWVSGAFGGGMLALGALVGGWICDRADRWTVYAVLGLVMSVCGLWLYLGPASPFTFAAGYSAYAFSSGLTNGAYVALILEILGGRARGASTGYALMSSSGNVPNIYMTWLDGMGYRHGGARGLMATDAAIGGVAGLILLWISRQYAQRWLKNAQEG